MVRVGMALATLAPPALVGVGLWPEVRSYPVLSAAVLTGYFLALAALRRPGGRRGERQVGAPGGGCC